MSVSHRAALSWRLRPAAAQALAWCGALAYPILLYGAVLDEHEPTGARLLLPAVLSVLTIPLLLRRPFPALLLMLAGSFAATVTAASQLASAFPFMAPGQAWQIGCLQAVLTDLAVAWIAATRTRRTALTAAALTLVEQIAAAGHYPVRHELGDGEHATGGHQFAQAPSVADLAWHQEVLPGRRAASVVASKARRRERVRKSEETQV
ncbi:hypothetical protein [Streptomyces cavernicola]|uniref:MASE1 domain-containing protein n=1 Tax=Streptomyces cavernicola TaxID=3043613 RepID=A0ABT6S545_9ACTN|nr:hypothetical protein [Streptomyces sp. B-S-A6]MDI3403218.1 hypothetical protein [Streptomyces sp. B-S-A6]